MRGVTTGLSSTPFDNKPKSGTNGQKQQDEVFLPTVS